jgi:hypothetical protein
MTTCSQSKISWIFLFSTLFNCGNACALYSLGASPNPAMHQVKELLIEKNSGVLSLGGCVDQVYGTPQNIIVPSADALRHKEQVDDTLRYHRHVVGINIEALSQIRFEWWRNIRRFTAKT